MGAQPARDFAKKSKKAKQNPADATEYETVDEPVQEHVEVEKPKAAPKAAAPKATGAEPWLIQTVVLDLDKALFQPFSIGDVKQVDSTPDNKAPSFEDTIEGRYANVLFTTASQKSALYTVYEDMMYLSELYKYSEVFRSFTENGGVGTKEIGDLNKVLRDLAPFHETTLHFLTVLAENKRLVLIEEIAMKYKKLYQQFNKEEKITIISAEELNANQQNQVMQALKENPHNAGKDFTIEYQVDKSIQGGLQMYTESEFMDMSVSSRMLRINEEVAKLVM